MFWHELNVTEQSAREFHSFIQNNRIFLSRDLKEIFTAIDDLIWDSILTKENEHRMNDFSDERKSYIEVYNEITPLIEKIEDLVQKRLQYTEAD